MIFFSNFKPSLSIFLAVMVNFKGLPNKRIMLCHCFHFFMLFSAMKGNE